MSWVTAGEARDPGFTNYDGDTFRATFRVSNIDAPEISGNATQKGGWLDKPRSSLSSSCFVGT